ncbi:Sensor protein [Oleispira antarctica RB-8]|uniref:histidine kinase n=1 Tax=Oleispira antarctica RB-8 TaxID=698738 RepID=R4YPR1_OLEAN|nr:Sensor protein [Oleispira antarctica RB-8]
MLIRQKVITATIFTCIFIVILATTAYILAADRIGREQLAPQISRSFADIFQLQLQQNPDDILALKAIANSMVQHYQIQEIAFYNAKNERIIYVCSNTCLRNAPIKFNPKSVKHRIASNHHFIYSLHSNNSDTPLRLIIESKIGLARFFYADTASTALLIVSISTLLLFFLYNSIRFWQRSPYQNLLMTIEKIQSQPDNSIRFDLKDADTAKLSEALNTLIIINEDRKIILTKEKEKAESARIRAIRLSNETRHTNEKLAREITIRRSVESQLTHTRSILDSIIDSMPSALFTLDNNGYIIQCNQQAADWLACERHPLVGKRLSNYIEELKDFNTLINQSLTENCVKKIERLKLSLPIGTFPADIAIYPLKDNNLQGLVIRIDDISQREKMEEVIMQTEKMKSVGGLAAGMAHEINNPLGAILQGIQNIQRRIQVDNEKNKEIAASHNLDLKAMTGYLEQRQILKFINNIQDAGKRAASIVSNMLQFSRGNQKQLSPTLIKDLIERSLNLARADLELKNITIHLSYIDETLLFHCIPSELEQVILNLLQNSAQALSHYQPSHTDENWTPQINLSATQDNSHTYIKVKDNGPGMSKEVRRRIFEPFFTTKDIGAGTGLGLSVSYFIITAHHHGELEIESKPNQGACFTLKIPNQPLLPKP